MRQEDTVSARVRAIVQYHGGEVTLEEVQADVPEATGKLLYALTKAGHLKRTGSPRNFVYSPGKSPRVYGGTPEQRRATRQRHRERAAERARLKYAESVGGAVRSRKKAAAPAAKPKPAGRQRVVITPPVVAIFAPQPTAKGKRMTSQEFEAMGGVIERLPRGAVSRSELRHTYTA
ncbi:hypothetical protein WCE39_08060 [Luteimonas sp. MJ174]|uniref:hypothetical protein n=1 Tax=Luteimonas sp. MJ174 TaxID=3129237 RepID=UPI0031BA1341